MEIATEIANANKKLIQQCDIILANLSPFRGIEPDSGTVWECGYGEALGKYIYAYSTNRRDLKEKVIEFQGLEKNAEYCKDDMFIEDFELSDNLMFADKIIADSFIECLEIIKNDFKNKKTILKKLKKLN